MRRPEVTVYAGPTISAAEICAILPRARVRPPLGRGNILAEDWSPGDTAVVIDGYFRERRSVGHKEILWLLSQGVHVIGAASMGALRAAELAPYGMRGVGVVFRMFATGELDGDDEVGVLHGSADMGYPPRTVALVSLRYGCREGVRTNEIPAAAGERIIEAAEALPFMFRSWPDLEGAVDDDDRGWLRTLERKISSGEWDIKRLDALSALREAGSHRARAIGPLGPGVVATRITRDRLLAWQSRREYASGRWMSDLDVLDAARLFDGGYPAIHEAVLAGLLTDLAAAQDMTVGAYARARLGVDEDCVLPDRLASWLTEAELAQLPAAERIRLVMVRVWPVWQSADWRPAVVARLHESGRWPEFAAIVARADDAAEEAGHRLVVPPSAICGRLFLRHWHQPGMPARIELARRGFLGLDELGSSVRRFFAFDVRRGRGVAATR